MSTFDDVVREVRSTLRGYNLVREQVTFLNGSLTNSALTFTIDDGTLIQPGVVEIENECIWVQEIASNIATVAPDGRGWDGTTAASHADNKRVTVNPSYPTWRIAQAINDAIVGTAPTLFGVAVDTFVSSPVVSTYELPAETDAILQVTAPSIGPTGEQVEVKRYRFDANAPTGIYTSGKTITLNECVDPGQTVTVVYATAPAAIATGDDFTDSGLAETARACVVYGAVGRLLSYVDATRALTSSAVAAGYDSTNRIGSATQLAGQLTARYQMELEQEQRRQARLHPVKMRWVR